MAPFVTTTSITLNSNKNGDILVPADPGLPGKMAITYYQGYKTANPQDLHPCPQYDV